MNMSTNKNNLTKTNTTQSATKPTVIACLGASITAAKGSFNWIGELEKRPIQLKQFRFYNLGVGGDLAYSALQRLPSVVACHPDKVVIIVGHNAIAALVFKKVRRIFGGWKHLPSDPSHEWYRPELPPIVVPRTE